MLSELKQEWKKIIMEKLGLKKITFVDDYKGDDWTRGVYHIFWLSWNALKAFQLIQA